MGLALVRSIEERKETIDKFSSSMLPEHCSDLHIGPTSAGATPTWAFVKSLLSWKSSVFIAVDILDGKGRLEVDNDIDRVRAAAADPTRPGQPTQGSSSGRSNVDALREQSTASQRGRPLARPGQKVIVIAQANLQSPNR